MLYCFNHWQCIDVLLLFCCIVFLCVADNFVILFPSLLDYTGNCFIRLLANFFIYFFFFIKTCVYIFSQCCICLLIMSWYVCTVHIYHVFIGGYVIYIIFFFNKNKIEKESLNKKKNIQSDLYVTKSNIYYIFDIYSDTMCNVVQ